LLFGRRHAASAAAVIIRLTVSYWIFCFSNRVARFGGRFSGAGL